MQKAIWNGIECLIDIEKEKLSYRKIYYTSSGMRIGKEKSRSLSGFFMFAYPDVPALRWFQARKNPEVILSAPLIYHKNDFTPLQKQLVKNIIQDAVSKKLNMVKEKKYKPDDSMELVIDRLKFSIKSYRDNSYFDQQLLIRDVEKLIERVEEK